MNRRFGFVLAGLRCGAAIAMGLGLATPAAAGEGLCQNGNTKGPVPAGLVAYHVNRHIFPRACGNDISITRGHYLAFIERCGCEPGTQPYDAFKVAFDSVPSRAEYATTPRAEFETSCKLNREEQASRIGLPSTCQQGLTVIDRKEAK